MRYIETSSFINIHDTLDMEERDRALQYNVSVLNDSVKSDLIRKSITKTKCNVWRSQTVQKKVWNSRSHHIRSTSNFRTRVQQYGDYEDEE